MSIKRVLLLLLYLLSLLLLTACTDTSNSSDNTELVIYSPHPVAFINPLIEEFELSTGIEVEVVQGATGELLSLLEDAQAEQAADVFWGGSLSTTKPHMYLFAEYQSANEAFVKNECKNIEGPLTRFTDVPSVLMINTDLIGDIEIKGYADLLQPELSGKIAFADPARASSSYEHLINMLYACGNGDPEQGWNYVDALCTNLKGNLLGGSSDVYKGVADGRYTVGLTFEEGALNYVTSGEPVAIVYMEEGVIFKPDGVYIVKNCMHMSNAERFVDFITGKEAQTTIASKLNRRSVRTDVPDAENMLPKSDIKVIYDDEATVLEKKAEWLERFHEVFSNTQ